MVKAGLEGYEQLRDRIRAADVVHIDETGHSLDGEQWWPWTFRTDGDVLFALRESRGSGVVEDMLGEDFDGTIVCAGWSAYPAVRDDLQRCWAYPLREADNVAGDYPDAKPIAEEMH